MADFVADPAKRVLPQPEELRAAAVRYLTRTGNGDVLDVLGLTDEPEPGPVATKTKKPRQRKEKTT